MMVARHGDRPGVVGFEIMNEPSGGTMPSADWEVEVLSPFYTEMAARIQGADPDALVFFDSTGLQSAIAHVSLPQPEGDNLVFAPHFYDFGALFGGELSTDIAVGLGDWAAQGEEWNMPVLIGEFGIRPTTMRLRAMPACTTTPLMTWGCMAPGGSTAIRWTSGTRRTCRCWARMERSGRRC